MNRYLLLVPLFGFLSISTFCLGENTSEAFYRKILLSADVSELDPSQLPHIWIGPVSQKSKGKVDNKLIFDSFRYYGKRATRYSLKIADKKDIKIKGVEIMESLLRFRLHLLKGDVAEGNLILSNHLRYASAHVGFRLAQAGGVSSELVQDWCERSYSIDQIFREKLLAHQTERNVGFVDDGWESALKMDMHKSPGLRGLLVKGLTESIRKNPKLQYLNFDRNGRGALFDYANSLIVWKKALIILASKNAAGDDVIAKALKSAYVGKEWSHIMGGAMPPLQKVGEFIENKKDVQALIKLNLSSDELGQLSHFLQSLKTELKNPNALAALVESKIAAL